MENEKTGPIISFSTIVEDILPFTQEDMKCLQKHMMKQRNRDMLKRVLKTMAENPYKRYFFESKTE